MAQSTQPSVLSQDQMEAFSVLVLRYLDGACSAEEGKQMTDALTGSALHRELFVHLCRAQGNLHEAHAPKRAELQQRTLSLPVEQVSVASNLAGDPGAETIIAELTGEDTLHPAPKQPQ